ELFERQKPGAQRFLGVPKFSSAAALELAWPQVGRKFCQLTRHRHKWWQVPRGGHHQALVAEALERSVETVSCRPCFIAKRQMTVCRCKLCHEVSDRCLRGKELPEIPHLAATAAIGNSTADFLPSVPRVRARRRLSQKENPQ